MNSKQDPNRTTSNSETSEPALRPPVDIFEDAGGITVSADMPGVARERLDVHVDGDTLYIEGQADLQMPEGMQALYADVRSTRYQRSFALSRELDAEHIRASLTDGVLTLHIPKRAEHQPRRIQVETD